jgi:hypothetical protein
LKNKQEDPIKAAIRRRDCGRLRRLADSVRAPRRRMALLFLSDLVADQIRSDGRSTAVAASNAAVRRAG